MAWDDWIQEEDYDSTLRRMERAYAEDVMRRAVTAGVEVHQFANLHECDMYLQMLPEASDGN